MAQWFYPDDFPPEFNANSPPFVTARWRSELLHALEDVVPNADVLVRLIDGLIQAKLDERAGSALGTSTMSATRAGR